MSGFRPRRGTIDTLLDLDHHVQEGFGRGRFTLTAFLDLEGAFDSASHNAILYKLSSLGLFGAPLLWVRSFLSSRTFSVSIGTTFSHPYPIRRGVPQGSPLSPLLFNVLLSDLPSPPSTHTFLYADDISLLCSAPSLPEAQTLLQGGLDAICQWCTQWGLTLCAPKSCLMCFTRRRIPAIPQAHLTGTVIPFRTTHRFLGLVLDGPRLTWKRHISALRSSCLPRLNLMRALAGLQVVQNTALRIALGAFRSSPTLALQAEAGLPSLDHRRNTKTIPWTKADCPHQGKALFLTLLSTKYRDTFFIFTDGSHIPSPPSTSAAIYLPTLHTSTNWKLQPHTTILGAELFAIREGLTAATTLPPHLSVSLFTDSLTSLQLISTHRPHTHHTLCFAIHSLLAQLTSGGRRVHLQWVPSHIGIMGNTVVDQAANLAHTHPQPIPSPPDHSDLKIHLRQSSNRHWTTRLTIDLRQLTLGHYRHSPAQHWRPFSPIRPLDTAITRLRIGHTRLNAHLHRLNIDGQHNQQLLITTTTDGALEAVGPQPK
ncbi:uncharacterized protein LOC127002297 [Eriocheir sinensis]|uniref:uncharacterized protein LOC127002297 n=1 Tax=Eriocheir sinensis TaxID=95602 RepID=UPI0021C87A3D|nr:uncharacterized protein LOC127002297 [Eriocheir sinensis]